MSVVPVVTLRREVYHTRMRFSDAYEANHGTKAGDHVSLYPLFLDK